MEKSIVMNGGEGPKSYFKNSKIQEKYLDDAKDLLTNSIQGSLEVDLQLQIFSIVDLGCSVGPNTFSCVNNMIKAVQFMYRTQSPNNQCKIPEFLVFFNDQVTNDFNTLFKALPSDRQYMAAGVPGSFYRRLFPESSINLMHLSTALQWLRVVPDEVGKRGSPLWNKGRITYARSSIQVADAFRAHFFNDMKDFLEARSQELVPGGLLAILMCCREEGSLPSESISIRILECLGDVIADMVSEGIISGDLMNSFNVPVFFPTVSEVKEIVISCGKHLDIERCERIRVAPVLGRPEDAQVLSAHIRAALEGSVCEHFGPKLVDELFHRLPQKLEIFSKTPHYRGCMAQENLFLLLKRKDVLKLGTN